MQTRCQSTVPLGVRHVGEYVEDGRFEQAPDCHPGAKIELVSSLAGDFGAENKSNVDQAGDRIAVLNQPSDPAAQPVLHGHRLHRRHGQHDLIGSQQSHHQPADEQIRRQDAA